jgi:LDH2 family malate/lactate/ureidoglycolate dehydrogenase
MIDRRGLPVTDPAGLESGDAHLLLLGGSPAGGAYKGLGLTLLVDILCGALAGSEAGPRRAALSGGRAPTADDEGVGHSFIVIDPGPLRGSEGFDAHLAEMLSAVADCPPSTGEGSLAYPGLRESQHAARVREDGVELMPWLLDSLTGLADRFRIDLPTQVLR